MLASSSVGTVSTSYYHRSLPLRLEKGILFARTRPPAQVRVQFKNMVALLEQAWRNPHLHPQALDLVAALYPWPKRWGFIWEWIGLLTEAVAVGREHGRVADEIRFATHLAELFFAIGNHSEALRLGQRTLHLAQSQPQPATLAVAQSGWIVCQALQQSDRTAESDALLQRLDAQLPPATDPDHGLTARFILAILHTRRLRRLVDLAPAFELWEPLWAALEAKNDDESMPVEIHGRGHSSYAFLLFDANNPREMAHHLERTVALYKQIGDEIAATTAQGELAYAYMVTGRLHTAQTLLRQVIQQAEQHRLQQELATYTCYLSFVYLVRGEIELSRTYIQRGLQLHRQLGNERWVWLAQLNHASVLIHLGELEQASTEIHACREYYETHDQAHLALMCDLDICLVHWQRGEQAAGYALAYHIVTQNQTTRLAKHLPLVLFGYRCLALFLPPAEAIIYLEKGLALARELKLPLQEGACLLSLAGLMGADRERQAALWGEGVQILADMGAEAWVVGCSPQKPPFVVMSY